MKAPLLSALREALAARRQTALVTDLDSGAQALFDAESVQGDLALTPAEAAAVSGRLRVGASGLMDGERPLFIDVHEPPPRIIVIGAVHVTQHLIALAKVIGLDVIVIDPRTVFATPERFPGVRLITEWPDDALPEVGLDAHTAVVTLTHDPKLDDPALRLALLSPAFYVGALGSRKTHVKRMERLGDAGLSRDTIARLRAPVGLNIGATGPAEIALSIIAEITALRRGVTP